jgi:hypothetical protein
MALTSFTIAHMFALQLRHMVLQKYLARQPKLLPERMIRHKSQHYTTASARLLRHE